MSWVKAAAGILGIVYVMLCSALFAMQDRFLFLPDMTRVAPEIEGIEAVELSTADGETLVAWYAPPREGCPVIFHLHGNGGRIDLDTWRYKRIMDRGGGLLALSYRGYAGSTGKPSEAGFYADGQAGWDWLRAKGVPAGDIVIEGHSIGSGTAVKLASEQDEGALILEAPFFSLQDRVQHGFPGVPTGLLLRHKFRNDLRIANINAPLFVSHGTRDSVIPIDQSERLYALARAPKVYRRMTGSDHNTLVRDGVYDDIWPFLAEYWQPAQRQPGRPDCDFEGEEEAAKPVETPVTAAPLKP